MLRIVLTGPESTGKTTLALHLAAYYGVPWVPEYARTYLDNLKRDYVEADLLEIAKGQIYREDRISAGHPAILFCDTDLITIKIWSEVKFGKTDPWILEQIKSRHYDHYFLCDTNIPWEPDPLREHPNQREALSELYLHELKSMGKSFSTIKGTLQERINKTIEFIELFSIAL